MASYHRRMRARASLLRGLFVTREWWKGAEEIAEEDRGEAIMLRFSVEKTYRLYVREVGFLRPRRISLASVCRVTKNVAIGLKEEWDRGGLRHEADGLVGGLLGLYFFFYL